MYSAGPSGMQHAPVTKLMLLVMVGGTLVVNYMNVKTKNTQTPPSPLQSITPYRLITNNLYFTSIGEAMFGSFLIYTFRMFERMMGSSKYSFFIISSIIISTLIELSYPLFGKSLYAGPYAIIFSTLILFYKEVPATHWFKLFGFPFNDKIFAYILALQILYIYPNSIGAAVAGLISGVLYYSDFISLRSKRIPKSISAWFSRWFVPFLSTNSTTNTSLRTIIEMQQNQRRMQQQMANRLFNNPNNMQQQAMYNNNMMNQPLQPPAQPPNEADIQTLESMGFPRTRVIEALRIANNDLNTATNYLLGTL